MPPCSSFSGPRHSVPQQPSLRLTWVMFNCRKSPGPRIYPLPFPGASLSWRHLISVRYKDSASSLFQFGATLKGRPRSRALCGVNWCLCYDSMVAQILPLRNPASLTSLPALFLRPFLTPNKSAACKQSSQNLFLREPTCYELCSPKIHRLKSLPPECDCVWTWGL